MTRNGAEVMQCIAVPVLDWIRVPVVRAESADRWADLHA